MQALLTGILLQGSRSNYESAASSFRDVGSSYQQFLRVLNKPHKSDQDCEQIHTFVKDLFFFKQFKEDLEKDCESKELAHSLLMSIIKEMRLEQFDEHTLIFEENDPSNNKAYIILEGSIGVWKKNQTMAFEDDFNKLKTLHVRNNKRVSQFGSKRVLAPKHHIANKQNPEKQIDGEQKKVIKKDTLTGKKNKSEKSPTVIYKSKPKRSFDLNSDLFDFKNKKKRQSILIKPSFNETGVKKLDEPENMGKSFWASIRNSHAKPEPEDKQKSFWASIRASHNKPQTDNKLKPDTLKKQAPQAYQRMDNYNRNISLHYEDVSPNNFIIDSLINNEEEIDNKSLDVSAISETVSVDHVSEKTQTVDWLNLVSNQFGDQRVVLKKGFMFGEIAQSENKARQATILSVQDSKLIVIRKEQFDIIRKINLQGKQDKREFLYRLMPKLNEINATKYVEDLLRSVQAVKFNKDSTITKQNKEGDTVYFLKSGTVKVFYKQKSNKTVNTTEVWPGTVIGEECLFDENNLYKYTTKVSSMEASFLTQTKKYCTTKQPFQVQQDICTKSKLKDEYRLKVCSKLMSEENDMNEFVQAVRPNLFVKDELMRYNVRKNIDAIGDPYESVPIDTKIQYKKYYEVNFKKNLELNEQKWIQQMQNHKKKDLPKNSPFAKRLCETMPTKLNDGQTKSNTFLQNLSKKNSSKLEFSEMHDWVRRQECEDTAYFDKLANEITNKNINTDNPNNIYMTDDAKAIKKDDKNLFKNKILNTPRPLKSKENDEKLWEQDTDLYDVFGKERNVSNKNTFTPSKFLSTTKQSGLSLLGTQSQKNDITQSACKISLSKRMTEPNFSEIMLNRAKKIKFQVKNQNNQKVELIETDMSKTYDKSTFDQFGNSKSNFDLIGPKTDRAFDVPRKLNQHTKSYDQRQGFFKKNDKRTSLATKNYDVLNFKKHENNIPNVLSRRVSEQDDVFTYSLQNIDHSNSNYEKYRIESSPRTIVQNEIFSKIDLQKSKPSIVESKFFTRPIKSNLVSKSHDYNNKPIKLQPEPTGINNQGNNMKTSMSGEFLQKLTTMKRNCSVTQLVNLVQENQMGIEKLSKDKFKLKNFSISNRMQFKRPDFFEQKRPIFSNREFDLNLEKPDSTKIRQDVIDNEPKALRERIQSCTDSLNTPKNEPIYKNYKGIDLFNRKNLSVYGIEKKKKVGDEM